MKLDWIEDILAVLDTGSFTAASERRYLTPSAFTRRIRGIEDALGCALFDRERKPVTLLPHVLNMEFELRAAARQFRELRLGLSDIHGRHRKRLSLGCQHALTTMVAPGMARSLGQDREVQMRIRSGSRSECHLMLLRQEIDFGLIYETAEDALQFDTGLFEQITLGVDRLIPVVNLREHDGLRRALEQKDLPLITYPSSIYLGEVLRVHVLPNLARDITTYSVAETGLTPAVLQFIRQGLGIGWLPRSVAHEALARGELVDLSTELPSTALTIKVVRTRSGGSDLSRDAWTRLRDEATVVRVNGIENAVDHSN